MIPSNNINACPPVNSLTLSPQRSLRRPHSRPNWCRAASPTVGAGPGFRWGPATRRGSRAEGGGQRWLWRRSEAGSVCARPSGAARPGQRYRGFKCSSFFANTRSPRWGKRPHGFFMSYRRWREPGGRGAGDSVPQRTRSWGTSTGWRGSSWRSSFYSMRERGQPFGAIMLLGTAVKGELEETRRREAEASGGGRGRSSNCSCRADLLSGTAPIRQQWCWILKTTDCETA